MTTPTLPQIPAITGITDPALAKILQAMKDIVEIRSGQRNSTEGEFSTLTSPNFLRVPTAPTAASGTNTTQLATTEFAAAAADLVKAKAPIMTHVITTSTQALAADSTTQITGLNAKITPSSTAKRVKIYVRWGGEAPGTENMSWGLQRGTTQIGNPDAAGARPLGITNSSISFSANDGQSPEQASFTYIDSPASTAELTYSATVRVADAKTIYNQRTVSDADNNLHERMTSTIILEEIN